MRASEHRGSQPKDVPPSEAPTLRTKPFAWLIRRGEQVVGFWDLSTLESWITAGRLTVEDQISRDGASWQPLGNIIDFRPLFAAAAVSPGWSPPITAIQAAIDEHPVEQHPRPFRGAHPQVHASPKQIKQRAPAAHRFSDELDLRRDLDVDGDAIVHGFERHRRLRSAALILFGLAALTWVTLGSLSLDAGGAARLRRMIESFVVAPPSAPAVLVPAPKADTPPAEEPAPAPTAAPDEAAPAPSATPAPKEAAKAEPRPARLAPEPAPAHLAEPTAGSLERGRALMTAGKPREALLAFEQAAEREGQAAPGHTGMGLAYLALDKPAAALAQFQRAIAAKDSHADAWFGAGEAQRALGHVAQAHAAYSRYLELEPKGAHAAAAKEAEWSLRLDEDSDSERE